MKKLIIILTIVMIALLLVGCEKKDSQPVEIYGSWVEDRTQTSGGVGSLESIKMNIWNPSRYIQDSLRVDLEQRLFNKFGEQAATHLYWRKNEESIEFFSNGIYKFQAKRHIIGYAKEGTEWKEIGAANVFTPCNIFINAFEPVIDIFIIQDDILSIQVSSGYTKRFKSSMIILTENTLSLDYDWDSDFRDTGVKNYTRVNNINWHE